MSNRARLLVELAVRSQENKTAASVDNKREMILTETNLDNVFDSDDSVQDPDFFPPPDDDSSSDLNDDELCGTHNTTPNKKYAAKNKGKTKLTTTNLTCAADVSPIESQQIIKNVPTVHTSCSVIEPIYKRKSSATQEELEVTENNENIAETGNKKGRSRKEREEAKKLRNAGKSYKSEKGKIVQSRTLKDLEKCRMKCCDRLLKEGRKKCFEEYWNLGSRDKRASYVASHINIQPKKTAKLENTKNRQYSYTYDIIINNTKQPICKKCFCAVLGETKGFVELVAEKKKKSSSGIIAPDSRGLTPSRNRRTEEDIKSAKDHILSYPHYESHYCRNRSVKKYLSSDLSISKMYEMYKEKNENPISLTLYSTCFHDLNLAFKKPKQDTCFKCDLLNMKIQSAQGEDKITLLEEQEHHHHLADNAYNAKKVDKELALANSKIKAFAFDLQQCLPTPYLTANKVFYLRQLWTFNLTVHDLATNEATCYMWDETVSGRGGNQIASCLYHLLTNLSEEIEKVIFYSDTCGGQNKNQHVAFMFNFAMKNCPNIKEISHKFLISGHTHMECDSDHAIIEKEKKRTGIKINHPNDWYQLVRSCRKKNHFTVVVMKKENFFDFSIAAKNLFGTKKINEDGENFLWQPVQWLQYLNNEFGIIRYKTNLDNNYPFKILNLRKRGKMSLPAALPLVSDKPLPISKKKKDNLLELLPLIDDVFKDFYKNLLTEDNITEDVDPDLIEISPDT